MLLYMEKLGKTIKSPVRIQTTDCGNINIY